ncbi:MAG: sigma 54 modulation/S30EA ribosomal C-terminal domain-containing protein [Micromonosporaceae bacterium]
MDGTRTLQVQTQARGAVPQSAMDLAVERIRSLMRLAPEPVLFARVKLTMAADPAVERPAIAESNLDLNGRLIRAQAVAGTMREAVEHMSDRLRIQLERAARNWAAIRGRKPAPETHEWRHESIPSRRTAYFPRPEDGRAVVKRKSYAPAPQTPDEAIADMELLDHDFYLFTERSTGEDSVVYRADGGYRLAQAHLRRRRLGPVSPSITVSGRSAPRLTPAEAMERLEALGQPFLFFVDGETGRGNLIYHRYDGHYGLICPADTAS